MRAFVAMLCFAGLASTSVWAQEPKSCTVNAFGFAGQRESASDTVSAQIAQKNCTKGDILIISAEMSQYLANVSPFAADYCDFGQQIVIEHERGAKGRSLVVCSYAGARRVRR